MASKLEKIVSYAFYLFIFLLPWQTRWIWHQGFLNGGAWEYGTLSLYGVDILFVLIFLVSIFLPRPKKPRHGVFLMIIAGLALVSFISIIYSQNREVSWYYFLKLAEAVLLVVYVLRQPLHWRKISLAFISAGVIQAVLGIYQFFTQSVFASKWLGMAAQSPDQIVGESVVATSAGRWLRAYGSFPHPNILAGFLVVCLIFLIGYLFIIRAHLRVRVWQIVLTVSAFVVTAFGLILTFSRAAWLVFGVCLLFCLLIAWLQKNKFRVRILLEIFAWLIMLAVFSYVQLPELWHTRLTATGRLETMSLTQRTEQYSQAETVLNKYWTYGAGLGSYTYALYQNHSSLEAWDYQPVHNIYILAAAEIGVFGGLLILLLAMEFFRQAFVIHWKKLDEDQWFFVYTIAFLALLLLGFFDHYLWTMSFGVLFFWLIFGLWLKRLRRVTDKSRD